MNKEESTLQSFFGCHIALAINTAKISKLAEQKTK
jgi:hypothetical protein